MTAFGLLAASFIMNVVAVLFVLCCIALILIVLVQKGRGGGLSGAFGGAMASGILGSKTGDFLTWVTIVLAGVYLILAVISAKFLKGDEVSNFGQQQTVRQQVPVSQREATTPITEVPVEQEMTDESGDLETDQPELPVTGEAELPADGADEGTGGAENDNDVNLPGG
ncbi:MAG: preprotein translocase subunit SecG [Sedimentisphaerales bacterium]|nr:preprotein translocase subunit SecG [Sedimentisphaerales bacterium]